MTDRPAFLDGPVIRSEFRVAAIPDKEIRDILRRAFRDTRHGPVAALGATANCLGYLISEGDAAILAEAKARLAGKGSETEATPQD